MVTRSQKNHLKKTNLPRTGQCLNRPRKALLLERELIKLELPTTAFPLIKNIRTSSLKNERKPSTILLRLASRGLTEIIDIEGAELGAIDVFSGAKSQSNVSDAASSILSSR